MEASTYVHVHMDKNIIFASTTLDYPSKLKTMQFLTQPNQSLYRKKERGVDLSRIKGGGLKNNLFVCY